MRTLIGVAFAVAVGLVAIVALMVDAGWPGGWPALVVAGGITGACVAVCLLVPDQS